MNLVAEDQDMRKMFGTVDSEYEIYVECMKAFPDEETLTFEEWVSV
jgi:hypothetical protein